MAEELVTPQMLDDELLCSSDIDQFRVLKDLLAGTSGGIAQVLVGQPFDTTKVRLQTATKTVSAINVVKDLLKYEGPLGFYKGTLTPLIGVGACVSVQFGVNEWMKRFFHNRDGNSAATSNRSKTLTLPQYYVCGLTGGVINSFLSSPIEHVRIRLQIQTKSGSNAEFKGPLDCIKKLAAQGQLMRGFPIMVLRAGHGLGVYFLVYEALISSQIKKGFNRTELETWKLCMYGAAAGTTLWIAVYPLDVIKSVVQSDNLRNPKYSTSIVKVAKALYAKEGMHAFFKGFVPTMLRATPANAATFTAFEMAMRLMD